MNLSSLRLLLGPLVLAAFLLLVGCLRPSPDGPNTPPATLPAEVNSSPTPTLAPTAAPASVTAAAPIPNSPGTPPPPSPTPATVTTPDVAETGPRCGIFLPILPAAIRRVNELQPDEAALQQVESMLPDAARPALAQLLEQPRGVSLAAYQVGRESEGVYLNGDAPMPLASVVKLVHLAAYAEAVAVGELDPNQLVTIEELESYYLPGLDLGAHNAALDELEASGRMLANPPAVRLEEVAWMMIRHSSNAAMDFLQLLLGQERIEETALQLGLGSQTAPCPFLGQFLAMSNHTRLGASDLDTVLGFIDDPAAYGAEAMRLTLEYSQDADFRRAETSGRHRPAMTVQRAFSESLNPQGSARDYAALMARFAQNGLSSGESSFTARRILEWPMQFEVNQELFSNLGYKNGAMPGVLTSAYYAYRNGESSPVVVVLFFRDLPNRTYQSWRRSSLAHDELARWLLIEPQAIKLLRQTLALP